MRWRRRGQTDEEYAKALLDGMNLGMAGVTEMLDGAIAGGVETIEVVDVRSAVEQLRMRMALSMDAKEIAADFAKEHKT